MASEPEATAEARLALGAELAAYRRAAGFTQTRFAGLTGYSRSTVANVETGRQRVPRAFWERCDAALRTGGVLATAHDELEAGIRRNLRVAARAVSKTRQQRTPQPPPSAGNSEDEERINLAPAPSSGRGIPAPPGRVGRIPPLWPPAADAAALPRLLRQVTQGDLARLRSMRAHLKSIDNAHGGGAALPMATWYLRHEILPLLGGKGDPSARALLEVVALLIAREPAPNASALS